MGASASVIQEYYKAVDYWAEIEVRKDWKLAIWVVEATDVDLIDRFFEIERSPVGQFDDIFFRFDTIYEGDDEKFTEQLWKEYVSWFTEEIDEKYDVLKALKQDGLLTGEYFPRTDIPHTTVALWQEMLRLKSCISGLEDTNFCIYFPPGQLKGPQRAEWFSKVLSEGVPQEIRLATIDIAGNRSIRLDNSRMVACIYPKFNLVQALRNRMAQGDAGGDLTAPENKFKQQVTVVMDCTQKQDKKLLGRKVNKLLDIAKELKDNGIYISSLFIASEAFYAIREYKDSMKYSEITLNEAQKAMMGGDTTGYSYWKMAASMKAAILTAEKKRDEAISLYKEIALKAVEQKDAYYVMEGYRMCGFLRYEEGKMESAFEFFLLSLAGGSYLPENIRRNSTFTYAAYLALHTGKQVRAPSDIEILEKQLQEWLGKDWRELVDNSSMQQAKARRKKNIFS